jgi:hypothetical protein
MTLSMHDWSLLSVAIDWKSGGVRIDVRSASGETSIRASDLHEIHMPRHRAWGPSVSIYDVIGPAQREDGHASLTIEMQSGDRIEVVARSIEMPERSRA